MKSIKGDVNAGYGYTSNVAPATLLVSSKQFYTNIWCKNEWSKVDPRDAQILALTTSIEKHPSKQSHGSGGYSGSGYGSLKEETITGMNSFKKWRTMNKGPTLMKDGVNHHWWKQHVYEGRYDGLYYHNNNAATHEQQAAKKHGGRAAKSTVSDPAAPTPALEPNLMISDSIRNALCTNFCISEEDLAKVVNESVNYVVRRNRVAVN